MEDRVRRYRQSPITNANPEDTLTNVRFTRLAVTDGPSQWLTFGPWSPNKPGSKKTVYLKVYCVNRRCRRREIQNIYSTLLEPQSRFGDKSLNFQVVCPQNGTAVLKGLTVLELQSRFGDVPLKFQVICPQLSPTRNCSPKRVNSEKGPMVTHGRGLQSSRYRIGCVPIVLLRFVSPPLDAIAILLEVVATCSSTGLFRALRVCLIDYVGRVH